MGSKRDLRFLKVTPADEEEIAFENNGYDEIIKFNQKMKQKKLFKRQEHSLVNEGEEIITADRN